MLHTERTITWRFVIKKSIAGQIFKTFLRTAKGTAALRGYFEGDPLIKHLSIQEYSGVCYNE
jgi:hypothetical protein